MKLALVVPGGVDRSGVDRVVPALLWQIERLARRYTVHVFALAQEPLPAQWSLLGATVHNIGTAPGRRKRFFRSFAMEHARAPFPAVADYLGIPFNAAGRMRFSPAPALSLELAVLECCQ